MRKLIYVFLAVSGLSVFLLLVSLVAATVFPGGATGMLRTIDLVAALLAMAMLCLGMYLAWELAERLLQGEFHLDEALDEVKRLTSVIDKSFDGIVLTDLRGVIRHVNPQWVTITGWTAEEVEGKMTPAILKSGYQATNFYSNFWLTIQNGKTFRGELINKRKDGKYYHVDEIVLPLKNRHGRLTGYAAFHHVLEADYKPSSPPPVQKVDVEGT